MQKRCVQVLAVVVGLCFGSCQPKPAPKATIDVFDKEVALTSDVFLTSDTMFGKPYDIVVADSLLLIADSYAGQCLTAVNTKTKRMLYRSLFIGRGPNEVIFPIDISVSSPGCLGVFERSSAVFSEYKLADLGSPDQMQKMATPFQNHPGRVCKLGETGFVGVGPFDGGVITLYDPQGEPAGVFGAYPEKSKRFSTPFAAFLAYQTAMAVSPDHKHMAIAANFCDWISFYEAVADSMVEVKRYEFGDVMAKMGNDAMNISLSPDNQFYYTVAEATPSFVYIYYANSLMRNRAQEQPDPNYLFCFDWSGNPVALYRLDRRIKTFTVDESQGLVYAITDGSEVELITYRL